MFLERVNSIDSGMRNKVNDSNFDIGRRTDVDYAKDSGKLGSNVSSESW